MYLVIKGEGTFVIDDKEYEIKPYGLFIISDNQAYEYSGKMKMIEINIPATDSSNTERME